MRPPPTRRGPAARRDPGRLPENHRPPSVYRLVARPDAQPGVKGDLARDPRLALVEAGLFTADEPLTPKRLASVAQLADAAEARRLVKKLQSLYEKDGSAFQVAEIAGGYQLLTRAEFYPWLGKLRRAAADLKLSPAMREVLAIVAYRQPVVRADLEAIRGVQSGDLLRHLMEKGLIRIAGRDESLGRPVMYATTRKFLQLYGFNSLKDLPAVGRPGPSAAKPPAGAGEDPG